MSERPKEEAGETKFSFTELVGERGSGFILIRKTGEGFSLSGIGKFVLEKAEDDKLRLSVTGRAVVDEFHEFRLGKNYQLDDSDIKLYVGREARNRYEFVVQAPREVKIDFRQFTQREEPQH